MNIHLVVLSYTKAPVIHGPIFGVLILCEGVSLLAIRSLFCHSMSGFSKEFLRENGLLKSSTAITSYFCTMSAIVMSHNKKSS